MLSEIKKIIINFAKKHDLQIVDPIYFDDRQNGLKWDWEENGHLPPFKAWSEDECQCVVLFIDKNGSCKLNGYDRTKKDDGFPLYQEIMDYPVKKAQTLYFLEENFNIIEDSGIERLWL